MTLYVPTPEKGRLEDIRKRFNPIQQALIATHVTLCRDEDNADWEKVRLRAESIGHFELTIRFGPPIREGNLVYLPALDQTEQFDALRVRLLEDESCRKQEPHITLIHPRNGRCSLEDFDQICLMLHESFDVTFRSMTLIEQVNGSAWKDLQSFP